MAIRISASPERAASASSPGEGRRRGRRSRSWPRSTRSPGGPVRCRSRRSRSTRAVRPAAMTLTLPPAGRSRSASMAASLAASRRLGTTSVAPMLAEASTIRTRSRARPGRPLEERPSGEQREGDDEQQLEQQQEAPPQPLPRCVGLDVGDEAAPQQRRRHDRLVPPQLEQVHRHDERQEQQPEQRERGRERHGCPSRGLAAAAARRRRDRPAGGRWAG